jgi:threonine synthase
MLDRTRFELPLDGPKVVVTMAESWASHLTCTRSGETQDLDRPAFLSSVGAPWRLDYALDAAAGASWRASLATRDWSLWRYRELLPPVAWESRIDLGEGGTPLVRPHPFLASGAEVLIKEEGANPTGSFKARGLSLAVNRARDLGAPGVELASAGNAAVALCAYAAAGGLAARVALPEVTPRRIVDLCHLHGAEVLIGGGTLVESRQLLAAVPKGYWDLSTFREPYRVEGKKTMGLEVVEQLGWEVPEWIVYPTGGGTGIVGMWKAFEELSRLGLLGSRRPRMVVVQMEGCAPLVRALREGTPAAREWEDTDTEVWGLRVPKALADFLVIEAVVESNGLGLDVSESAATAMTRRAGLAGLRLGPEGAAALCAVEQLHAQGLTAPGDRVVAFQTGNPDNYR